MGEGLHQNLTDVIRNSVLFCKLMRMTTPSEVGLFLLLLLLNTLALPVTEMGYMELRTHYVGNWSPRDIVPLK